MKIFICEEFIFGRPQKKNAVAVVIASSEQAASNMLDKEFERQGFSCAEDCLIKFTEVLLKKRKTGVFLLEHNLL